jgi:hypothetical protein
VHKNKTCLPNVKFTIEQAMKARRRVEVYVCSFSNLDARWGGWSSPRSGRFTPSKQNQYPLYSKICGSQGRSGWLRKISPHRNSIPGYSFPFTFQLFTWNVIRLPGQDSAVGRASGLWEGLPRNRG